MTVGCRANPHRKKPALAEMIFNKIKQHGFITHRAIRNKDHLANLFGRPLVFKGERQRVMHLGAAFGVEIGNAVKRVVDIGIGCRHRF